MLLRGSRFFVSTGSGAPKVPNASGQACSWVTLSPGVINTDTWSFRLEVGRGLAISPRKTLHVSKPEDREARAGYRAEKKKIMMTVMMIWWGIPVTKPPTKRFFPASSCFLPSCFQTPSFLVIIWETKFYITQNFVCLFLYALRFYVCNHLFTLENRCY